MRFENKNGLLEVLLDKSDILRIDSEGHLIGNYFEVWIERLNENQKYVIWQENGKIKIILQKGIYASQRFGYKPEEDNSMRLVFELKNKQQ